MFEITATPRKLGRMSVDIVTSWGSCSLKSLANGEYVCVRESMDCVGDRYCRGGGGRCGRGWFYRCRI
jgi:hypothetical protein